MTRHVAHDGLLFTIAVAADVFACEITHVQTN